MAKFVEGLLPTLKYCKKSLAQEVHQKNDILDCRWSKVEGGSLCLQHGHWVTVRPVRLAIHLSQNTQKRLRSAKNKKCIAGYFASLFSHFESLFLILHFAPGLAFVRKVKELCGIFFHEINKTRNSHEIWKCIVSVSY